MTSTSRISVRDAYFILLLSLGITNHVIMIPLLLHTAKRDAWLGIVLTLIISVFWVYLISFIIRRTHRKPIFTWLKERYGPFISWFLLILTSSFFFLMALIILRETVKWIKVSYLPQTPKGVVVFILLSLCVIIAYNGIRSIAIMSGVLLPVVWVLGNFVAIANLRYKEYSLLTPLFVEGYEPVLRSMIVAGGGFLELIVLVFLQHHLAKPVSYFSISIMAILLAGLTLGPLMGAIANFGPVVAAQARYPAFDQWKLVVVTKYINHLDFLALYQWMSGALIRITLFLFLITDTPPFKSKKRRLTTLIIIGALLFGLSLNAFVDKQIESFLFGGYSLVSLVFFSALTLILTFASFKFRSGEENA